MWQILHNNINWIGTIVLYIVLIIIFCVIIGIISYCIMELSEERKPKNDYEKAERWFNNKTPLAQLDLIYKMWKEK